MINQNELGYNFKEFLDNIIEESVEKFKILTCWSNETKKEYSRLLDELKDETLCRENTRQTGDRLERIVNFILNKSYFYSVHSDVHTATNEIDQVIVLSERGKQALYQCNIAKDLLFTTEDIFIGECKNYCAKLDVTYVGKFYSLMIATDMSFGIIFTKKGLTGKENEFADGYGLAKILRIIEKYRNNRDFYILSFTLDDFEELLKDKTIYNIINDKKIALKTSSSYKEIATSYVHENQNKIKEIISSI